MISIKVILLQISISFAGWENERFLLRFWKKIFIALFLISYKMKLNWYFMKNKYWAFWPIRVLSLHFYFMISLSFVSYMRLNWFSPWDQFWKSWVLIPLRLGSCFKKFGAALKWWTESNSWVPVLNCSKISEVIFLLWDLFIGLKLSMIHM